MSSSFKVMSTKRAAQRAINDALEQLHPEPPPPRIRYPITKPTPPDAQLVEACGPLQEIWLIRPGENPLPQGTRKAYTGSPLQLMLQVSPLYLYVVKEDGTIIYAPQVFINGRGKIKHTNLSDGEAVRVSGELRYDYAKNSWLINDAASQYSACPESKTRKLRPTRTKENLIAALKLVTLSGSKEQIMVKPVFSSEESSPLTTEAIIFPQVSEIYDLPLAALPAVVLKLWQSEVTEEIPDFERLLGAGQLARQLAVAEIETQLKEWLREQSDSNGMDVAGLFLMGYWLGQTAVDEELVEQLLAALEQANLHASARDSLIFALDAAKMGLKNEKLKSRFVAALNKLWQVRETNHYQPLVMEILTDNLAKTG